MFFDLRTMRGQARQGKIPAIQAQPEWLQLCKELILSRKGNVQLQIGVQFQYGQCAVVHTAKASGLIKESFTALAPLVRMLAPRTSFFPETLFLH